MEKDARAGMLLRELFQVSLYKRSQGRIARQATFATLAVALALGCWRLIDAVRDGGGDPVWQFGAPGLVLLAGLWVAFRLVNLPRFADFLIAVEAEMNKVSWPGKNELKQSVLVVIGFIFAMSALLAVYDLFWARLMPLILQPW